MGKAEEFEFGIGYMLGMPARNYNIVSDGRVQRILDEWKKYEDPHFGLLNDDELMKIIGLDTPLTQTIAEGQSISDYHRVVYHLRACVEASKSILAQQSEWMHHMESIFAFYEAMEWHNSLLLDMYAEDHPELIAFKIPKISDTQKELVRGAMNAALQEALKEIK